MYAISNTYRTYITDDTILGRSVKNKVVIDGTSYYSDSLKTNPKISHKATSFIGGFPSKTCNFEILNTNGTLSLNNKEIEVYKGLEINGATEWVLMGIFHADDEHITTNETSKSISFDGNDRAVYFDVQYNSDLEWDTSHTGLEIVQECCSKVGYTLDTTTFNFASYEFTSEPNFPDNTTYREVISRIAEIGGEIATITRDGHVQITGQYTTSMTSGKQKRKSITREPIYGPINTLILGKSNIEDNIVYQDAEMVEQDGVIEFKIEDNPYVDLIREDIIEDVANYIIGMSITPFSIKGFIDDFIYDLNDVIIVTDSDGNTFNAVMLDYETESRMRSNIGATYKQTEKIDYNIAGSTSKTLATVKLQVDYNNNQITSLVSQTNSLDQSVNDIQNNVANLTDELGNKVDIDTLDDIVVEKATQVVQTNTYIKSEIQSIVSGVGVDGVTVTALKTTSATLDENGMTYAKTGSNTTSTINQTGISVNDTNGNELLFAGVKEEDSESQVITENLKVNTYLICANGKGRIEEFEDIDSGTSGAGFFAL